MGYVIRPIPPEVYLSLPPEQRMELYRMERAHLVGVYNRQAPMAAGGVVVLVLAGVGLVLGGLFLLFRWAAGLP